MERPARTVQWLAAAALPAAATGGSLLADAHMSVAGLAMFYVVSIALAALFLDRLPGLASSLASVCALNFFFVPPRYTLAVDGAEYLWTLGVLLAMAVGLQALVASLREGRSRARRGEERAAQLHALTEALTQAADWRAIADTAAQRLRQIVDHPCAVFVRAAAPSDGGAASTECHAAGADEQRFHAAAAAWAMEHGRPLGRGCVDWPDLALWCAPAGRSGSTVAVQLSIDRTAPAPDEDTRQHWLALTRQVGLSLERAQAAQAARQAQEHARAEAARNTLLASLSHDLRTPLAAILGSAGTLREHGDSMPPAQRARLLETLETEVRDLGDMADDILQLARLSQPHTDLRLQWESLEDVLADAVARMRRRWPDTKIDLRAGPALPPIRAEAGLLAQLVANLIDNAVRHAGSRTRVLVTAGRSREGVFFAVRDHGWGLPPGDEAALFDRWNGGGDGHAGLGLALCRLIAQAHGGRIEARRCEPGAEFRVDLPVATPAPEQANP